MKTIAEMAREAGLHRTQHNLMSNPIQHRFSYDGYEENLKRFAQLVRADERAALSQYFNNHWRSDWSDWQIITAIEANGNI